MIYSQNVMDPQVTKIKNKFMFEINLILNISKKIYVHKILDSSKIRICMYSYNKLRLVF